MFVLSLKAPCYSISLAAKRRDNADKLFAEITAIDDFIDKLALHTTDSFIHGRDQVIARQQEEMLELSTPVVTLWDGIVALPLIGTLDSARTQVVMESLLPAIVQTNARFGSIDITGVPMVDFHLSRSDQAKDHYRRATDGCRMHFERNLAADSADDCPPRHQS